MPRRGSILLSTANEIGSALVNKLGGSGYSPVEWDKKINIMGIASEDIADALDNLIPSEGGGDRGSILISKANEIGAVLNKKFQTERGFKPKEWASAISKLTPLQVKTASGAIASFPDGANDVPISEGTFYIAPSQSGTGTPSPSNPRPIVGYTGMTIQQTGKNLIRLDSNTLVEAYNSTATYIDNGAKVEATGTYSRAVWKIPTKIGVTYTVSYKGLRNTGYGRVYYSWEYSTANRYGLTILTETETSYSFTFTAEHDYLYFYIYNTSSVNSGHTTVKDVQVEVGSTATTYEAYKAETPIVDAFGRTIYGGERSTDGTLTETWEAIAFDGSDDENWQTGVVGTYRRTFLSRTLKTTNCYANMLCDKMEASPDSENVDRGFSCRSTNYDSDRLYVFVPLSETSITDVTTFKTWLSNNPITICYPPNTPNEYSLSPISLSTYYGDNNVWCDTGDTSASYYADIDLNV